MKNIEHFKFYAGLWLSYLYKSFPVPKDIDVRWVEGKGYSGNRQFKTINEVHQSWDKYTSEFDKNPVEQEFWASQNTLVFLIKEGYIRTPDETEAEHGRFVFSKCVLTEKGLTMLMSKTFLDQRSMGEKVIEYLREGKYSQLFRLVRFW